jgi:hypothetical protein
MLDAFLRLEHAGQLFNIAGLSLYRYDFKTVVVIDVDMLARDDKRLKIVLDVHETVYQLPFVVIVAHSDGAHDLIVAQPLLFNKVFPDKVADGLGAIFVVLVLDMPVEFINKAFFKGNAKAVEVAHNSSVLKKKRICEKA